ncbi:hypothetical protein [uncultured Dysgonomonas sp.]|uniref:Uncharacterized protein n=1 Tax=uncultured Dysgonomonas sp. TaxID=206096 RepID=A0A212IXP1_9BACT|nr:hypothetical protein [uncultured Dysgonomonas sp.]SBV91968.1 hypothetical protein KL86DYS1_10482 [uncultured Dysgonomonas sp.]
MSKIRVGIDPGKKGALVEITDGVVTKKVPTPLIGNEYDIPSMNELISAYVGKDDVMVLLEDVHSLGGVSAAANASLMENKGVWIGLLIANKIPFTLVTPKEWQAFSWSGVEKVLKEKKSEKDRSITDTKATSLKAAVYLYPNEDLRKSDRAKNFDEGLVDSLLMAHYACHKI